MQSGNALSRAGRRDRLTAYPLVQEGTSECRAAADSDVDAIRAALGTLGEDDREVLTLTYWDGLTSDQVATPAFRDTDVRQGSQTSERALTGQ